MPVYIALLRGINIGPHKRMKMEKLAATCAACGWAGARTYIQTGNVVFKATGRSSPDALGKKLAAQIVADFGFSSDVILRTKEEMERIIERNPLLKQRGVDSEKLHVAFLAQLPPPEAVKKLESLTLPPDQAQVLKKEIYFYFPNGVSGSSLWKHALDKVIKVSATMRNWNTVNQVYEMARELT